MSEGENEPAAPDRPGARGLRWGRILAALVLVWLVWCGVQLVRAATGAASGRAAADRVRGETTAADLVAGRPLGDLNQAVADFGRARSAAEDPFLAPLREVPFFGRQLRGLAALSANARTVAAVSRQALVEGRALLGDHPHGGGARVSALRRLSGIAGRAYAGLGAIGPEPDHLIGPLASAKVKLDGDLVRLRRALVDGRDGAATVADLLAGPHHYLLLAANNAEMRAGSGMFLSAAEMSTNNGEISIGTVMPIADLNLPAGAVALTGDLAARWGWAEPNQEWRNLALSPRFDANAALAAQMWRAATGGTVDGVIAVDAVALRDLLSAVGGVGVGARTITAEVAVGFVLHDQYAGVSMSSSAAGRNDELGQLASAALKAAETRDISNSSLAERLATAAGARHILLWSADAHAEAVWQEIGAAGVISPGDVMVAALNNGGDKLDYFLRVHTTVLTTTTGAHTDVRIDATFDNLTPASGEASYVVGPLPGSPAPAGRYQGLASFTLPAQAAAIRIGGFADPPVAGSDGPAQVWAVPITIDRGATLTVSVTFRLPVAHGTMTVVPSARVPPETWTVNGREFQDDAYHVVSW
ncbi:MAG TPA: DUF4012 domain-containing protein [Acidimicrobiales bacterium]|nr:DUF4012 domain-containing protein [Acidimicrobiales bacterium]